MTFSAGFLGSLVMGCIALVLVAITVLVVLWVRDLSKGDLW